MTQPSTAAKQHYYRIANAGFFRREPLGGGAEREAGDELEGVEATAHQVFERDAAGEWVADGGRDFFIAGSEDGRNSDRGRRIAECRR